MVKAIDFAVRTSAGKVVRGAVAGDGGSEFLQVGSGESVSLNISQSSVLGYERQGKDLVMKLSMVVKSPLAVILNRTPAKIINFTSAPTAM